MTRLHADDSPYHYAGNNPVLFNDPLGDKVSGGNMFARMYDGFHAWKYGHSAQGFARWMDDAGFAGFGGQATGQGYFIGRPVEEIWMVSRYKNEDGSAGDIIDEYFDHYVYEGDEEIQSTPLEFLDFLNSNFGHEAARIKKRTSLTWFFGGRLPNGAFGLTGRNKDNSIDIYISKSSLMNKELLYLTIGHELIQADDFSNGNYEKWLKTINGSGLIGEAVTELIDAMMDYHAYSWANQVELNKGWSYGNQKKLAEVKSTLEIYSEMTGTNFLTFFKK